MNDMNSEKDISREAIVVVRICKTKKPLKPQGCLDHIGNVLYFQQ